MGLLCSLSSRTRCTHGHDHVVDLLLNVDGLIADGDLGDTGQVDEREVEDCEIKGRYGVSRETFRQTKKKMGGLRNTGFQRKCQGNFLVLILGKAAKSVDSSICVNIPLLETKLRSFP
jgi:hypothetical protein